jgi:hypothetical protein
VPAGEFLISSQPVGLRSVCEEESAIPALARSIPLGIFELSICVIYGADAVPGLRLPFGSAGERNYR